MHTNVLPVCMYMHCACAWYAQRPEEGFGSPWNWNYILLSTIMGVLGIDPELSARAASTLNSWATSPASLRSCFEDLWIFSYFIVLCTWVCICVPAPHVCSCQWRAKRASEPLKLGITQCECWELNLGSLQEQQVFFNHWTITSVPSKTFKTIWRCLFPQFLLNQCIKHLTWIYNVV